MLECVRYKLIAHECYTRHIACLLSMHALLLVSLHDASSPEANRPLRTVV